MRMSGHGGLLVAGAACVLAGSAGCAASMAEGARKIFSEKNVCPPERITVQRRDDIPPHVLLAPGQSQQPAPPPEVAGDPERLALWQKLHGEQAAALDQAGTTYQVSGCGKSAMWVCRHPSQAEVATGGSGMIVGDESTTVGDDTITGTKVISAVECLPPAGPEQDVLARIHAPDVVHLPPHTPLPAVPDALRGWKALAEVNLVTSRTGLLLNPGRKRADSSEAGAKCAQKGAALFEQLGWTAVFDPAQPHDLVMRSACTTNVVLATLEGTMYVLLPSDAVGPDKGPRIETPSGALIDKLQSLPAVLACPTPDERQCTTAVKEYAVAHFIGQVVGSAGLAQYLATLRATQH